VGDECRQRKAATLLAVQNSALVLRYPAMRAWFKLGGSSLPFVFAMTIVLSR